jgi:phenylpyruvate tautomerase PptA (4-oxalocrotonate tautomerase family)
MSEKITINKTAYNKSQFGQVINNQFNQFNPAPSASVALTIDVNQFFQAYENLFFQIPKVGDIKSHQYLVNKSSEYIGENAMSEEVQALLEEITQLRQENLDLQRQVITVQAESVNPTENSNANLNQVGATTRANPTFNPTITPQATNTSGGSGGGSGKPPGSKTTIQQTK